MNNEMDKTDLLRNRGMIEFLSFRSLVYIFLFFLSLYLFINYPEGSDLRVHTKIIEQLDEGKLVVPHFLYHLTVYGISKISHISFFNVSCLVMASCVVFSMGLVEWILRNSLKRKYSDYFLLLVSLALMLVSAIFFPLVNKKPYLGIWGPNPWHNPTYITARPFVVLSFYLYVREIIKPQAFETRFSLIRISILLVISALIKPNFILAFIPASIIACFFIKGRIMFMLKKTGWLLLPLFAVLVFQYLFTYYDMEGESSIQFCFFDSWYHYAKSALLAVLQATAFPLTVFVLMFNRLKKDKTLLFTWLLFIIGLLVFSLLRETGHREAHMNFAWTYMFCLNILFVFSTVSFLRWISDVPEDSGVFQIKLFLCNSVFCFHLLSGVYYVGYLISGHLL